MLQYHPLARSISFFLHINSVVAQIKHRKAKVTHKMTVQERITSAAAQNAQLLKTLSKTDYAASAVKQNKAYIAELEAQIVVDTKNVKTLGFKCDKERSEYEMYRDSHVKRLGYRMRGKKEDFQSKTEKEEREYQDALQILIQAKKRLETLQNNPKDAKAIEPELEAVSTRHTAAQTKLDALYNSIFSSPTPDFPAEDAAEEEVRQQQASYDEIQWLVVVRAFRFKEEGSLLLRF
jgi:hypothetical protein